MTAEETWISPLDRMLGMIARDGRPGAPSEGALRAAFEHSPFAGPEHWWIWAQGYDHALATTKETSR